MFNWVNQVSLYMDWSVLCIQVLGYNNICSVRVKTAGSAWVVVGKITGFLWTAQIINPFVVLPKHTCLYWGVILMSSVVNPLYHRVMQKHVELVRPSKQSSQIFSPLNCSVSLFYFCVCFPLVHASWDIFK